MKNIARHRLKLGVQPLAEASDEELAISDDAQAVANKCTNTGKPARKRSEKTRLDTNLKAVQSAGLTPSSIRFFSDGEFEIHFATGAIEEADDADAWFGSELD